MFSITSWIARAARFLADAWESQKAQVLCEDEPSTRRSLTWSSGPDDHENHPTMQETIAVNLGLLQSDLDQLLPIACQAATSADSARASRLLNEADAIAERYRNVRLCLLGDDDGDKLGEIFAAMSKCSEARRLLNAVHPMVWS